MNSRDRKSRRNRAGKESWGSLQKKIIEQRYEILETVSLRDVPLEERRREAQKPLFLTRYE